MIFPRSRLFNPIHVLLWLKVWNEELAAAAQFFSDKCKLGSNPDRNSSVPSFNSVGETVSVSGSSSISYANFINMAWIVRQITRYDFESNTCGGSSNACSDYIQVIPHNYIQN